MPTNNYYAMKDIVYPVSQHLLLNDFLEGTDNIAMMVSVKWRRPYKNSDILIRGNSVYANLAPHLKDLVQQLAFNLVCEFKKDRCVGKLLTTYHEPFRPTAENPDPRGSMAMYSKHDAERDEHDYWVTFGDTGKVNFRTIINGYGAEVGVGDLLRITT